MSNRMMCLIVISMAASLTGCGNDGGGGSKFVGEWSCERVATGSMKTVSIRHNGGNNYIFDDKQNFTYTDGMLVGSLGVKLSIEVAAQIQTAG